MQFLMCFEPRPCHPHGVPMQPVTLQLRWKLLLGLWKRGPDRVLTVTKLLLLLH